METNTNKFTRSAILISHDLQKETLTFAYKGQTPNKLGTYYLVHNSELHQLRKDIQQLIDVAQEMEEVLNLQDDLIQKQGMMINGLIAKSLHI